jgi:hypothetical protein
MMVINSPSNPSNPSRRRTTSTLHQVTAAAFRRLLLVVCGSGTRSSASAVNFPQGRAVPFAHILSYTQASTRTARSSDFRALQTFLPPIHPSKQRRLSVRRSSRHCCMRWGPSRTACIFFASSVITASVERCRFCVIPADIIKHSAPSRTAFSICSIPFRQHPQNQ